MFSALGKIITTPFAAIFRWLYLLTGSYGMAIILFGLLVKLVVLPFQIKSKRSMVRMGRLTNKQQELQKKYANNQQKYQEELQKLYMEAGVNPMGGCLWSMLPLFILIPLYSIIRQPITSMMLLSQEALTKLETMAEGLGFVAASGSSGAAYAQVSLSRFISDNWDKFEGAVEGLIPLNYNFFGVDLSVMPQTLVKNFEMSWPVIGVLLIPIISGVLSWLMSKVTMASNGQDQAAQQGQMKIMNLMMPLMSVWIGFVMPAALGIYWIANSVFAMIQEYILGKFYTKKLMAEEDERAAKIEESRHRRQEEAKKRAQEMREEELRNPKSKHRPSDKSKEKNSGEKKSSTNEAGRVGDRPYARGRSFVENRYEQE